MFSASTRRRRATTLACIASAAYCAAALAAEFPGGVQDTLGPQYEAAPDAPASRHQRRRPDSHLNDSIVRWNNIAIDASGLDHTPVGVGEQRVFGEQLGPGRASRAMAIVHVAIFEVVNAADRRYTSYLNFPRVQQPIHVRAAVAQAGHDTLAALYPSQSSQIDAYLAEELAGLPVSAATDAGRRVGRRAARLILAARARDRSAHTEPRVGVEYITNDAPGRWRQDPISRSPLALGAYWGRVKPFVLLSGRQFRVAPPPALDSAAYASAFEEVQRVGGDGLTTATGRSAEQTHAGIYWAYDGMPSLCAPPRLYNQIALTIAAQRGTRGLDLARLLALVNVAMADAGIAIWESKYAYDFWRPVTGIREADEGSGPSGAGDGNASTNGDPTFLPLGAPASNVKGPNFTPPFPAYPSGHAGFGAALFQILRNVYGTDQIPFTFVSDEFNGTTLANDGVARPLTLRRFVSLSQAEEENGQSRMYLGIHWAFDKSAGIAQGRAVANYVFRNAFAKARSGAPAT